MNRILKRVMPVILVLTGVILLCYPYVSEKLFENRVESQIKIYEDAMEKMDDDYDRMFKEARDYNRSLLESGAQLTDPFETQAKGEGNDRYETLLAVDETGIMGYLEIPAISVYLPIYHGTSPQVLARGAGHLEGTSLPVGGDACHSVLTGHRLLVHGSREVFSEEMYEANAQDNLREVESQWMISYRRAVLAGMIITVLLFGTLYALKCLRRRNKRRALNVRRAVGIVLLAAGLTGLMMPDLAMLMQRKETSHFIKEYEEDYGRTGENKSDSQTKTDANGETAFSGERDPLYQEILAYNQSIFEDGQSGFLDPWSFEQAPVDLSGFEDGIFGYIEIPALGQSFKLYLGATSENMFNGVAIMGETSIPIGGSNTNCVIAGHRGYNQHRTFFKDIEEICPGDEVYITNPWEKLTYIVESIDIIDPYDGDAIKIQPGRDMVTLLTCHPYLSNGEYRYLVYCVRADENPSYLEEAVYGIDEEMDREGDFTASDGTVYPLSGEEIQLENLFRKSCIFLLVGALTGYLLWGKISASRRKNRKNQP